MSKIIGVTVGTPYRPSKIVNEAKAYTDEAVAAIPFVVNGVTSGIEGSRTLDSLDKTFEEILAAVESGKNVIVRVFNSFEESTDVFNLAMHSEYGIQFTNFNDRYGFRIHVSPTGYFLSSWEDDKGSVAVTEHNADPEAHPKILEAVDQKFDSFTWLPVAGKNILAAEKTVTNVMGTPTATTGGFPDLTRDDVYIGMPMVVAWDGVEYPVTVKQQGTDPLDSYWVAGNASFLSGENTGEPFMLLIQTNNTTTMYKDGVPHVASVYVEADNPIPKEFLTEHNADPEAHADIREAIAGIQAGGGGSGKPGVVMDTNEPAAYEDGTHPVWVNPQGDYVLTAEDFGADPLGSADSALAEAKAYTDEKVANVPTLDETVNAVLDALSTWNGGSY